jgi:predicted ATPase/class 3 adenylate cyclase
MQCPRCQHENPDNARFCGDCGVTLEPRTCGACGAPVALGQKFCRSCGTPLDSLSASTRTPVPTSHDGERRQITVMFCDLVGSTALSARMDPEDLRDVIGVYHACAAEVVARYEGFVAQYLGDGVLVYFGYPRAHEDDAERAVRAGLALVEAVGQLGVASDSLQVRIGIATGLVVVGELIGSGETKERGALGETPNLAARLQAMATPNAVVVASSTRRLFGNLFECLDLGTIEVKGFSEPVSACQVLRPSSVQSRFEALRGPSLTPLVGREREIGLLLGCWEQSQLGEGQVVLLSGEPGIGKSRMIRALREQLAEETYTPLSFFCDPYHQTSALHPVIVQLERAAGFVADDSAKQRLDKLENTLSQAATGVAEAVPLIAALLSIATGDRYPPLSLTPQKQREKTLNALLAQFAALAAHRPVLMVFEDVHWIDPTSREFLEQLLERTQSWPMLLILTFRPEFDPPGAGAPHVTSLTLNRLSRKLGAALVERVTSGRALPRTVLNQIVTHTDGVPLFIEELTKTVLESGLLRDEGECYVLTGPLPPLAIPATLHDSLMARLDRLAPVKELAQVGAALGREFSHEVIAAVSPLGDDALHGALGQLVDAELVFRRGTPPNATYTFKHVLVQDAAYDSLLKSKRQQLHGRIADVLESRFPETTEAQPELLAHHCTQAGLVEKAVAYWHKAGRQAIARSAMTEAVAQLTKALDALGTLPGSPERHRNELELQLALGGALVAAKGWGAPEMGRAYARARELCREVGETSLLVTALWGLYQFHHNRAELDAGGAAAADLLCVAERQDETAVQAIGHRSVGIVLLFRGQLAAAMPHLERALAVDPQRHLRRILVPIDTRVSCLSFVAWNLLYQGYPDAALLRSRQALAEAHELSHPFTLAFARHVNCVFHQVRGDRSEVQRLAAMLIPLAADQGFPHLWGTGTIFHGWAVAAGGELKAGLVQMRQGLAAKQATGAELKVPYYLGLMAQLYQSADRAAEALPLLADAVARVDETEERWFEAELHRLRGEALLSLPGADRAEAEGCLGRALVVAREQNGKWWELRAATGLARLWREQGKRAEARDLLAPVYGWFTEGFDTADLRAAKALLEELSR